MIILIDFDEVIVDLRTNFFLDVVKRFGVRPIDGVVSWSVADYFPTLTKEQVEESLNNPKLYDTAAPIAGAIEGFHWLEDIGHECYIVTSNHGVEQLQGKFNWLRKYNLLRTWDGGEWPKQLICTKDKGMIRGDILIDDSYRNLKKATVKMPVLFLRYFNEQYRETYLTLDGWDKVQEKSWFNSYVNDGGT